MTSIITLLQLVAARDGRDRGRNGVVDLSEWGKTVTVSVKEHKWMKITWKGTYTIRLHHCIKK